MPEAPGDAALVDRARAGEAAAFEALVKRHQAAAFALAYQMVRHREDAQDIAQEAFVRVFRGLRDFQGQAAFKTWLHRIVVNLALDALRRRSRQPAAAYDDTREPGDEAREEVGAHPDEDPDRALQAREVGEAIRMALEEVPAPQRAALLLREVEGLSYQEIAEVLGCAVGTVMSRLHYARRRLRERLRPFLEELEEKE
ncbi:MAG TPA: sigma-70 family RNA polymerase sigma factor [Candidatus Methylomirabilis sp.]|nr:sigma-70 family RNA polymerase sigma factor [Candidatus Methylomirabilis sp.]